MAKTYQDILSELAGRKDRIPSLQVPRPLGKKPQTAPQQKNLFQLLWDYASYIKTLEAGSESWGRLLNQSEEVYQQIADEQDKDLYADVAIQLISALEKAWCESMARTSSEEADTQKPRMIA